MRGLQAEEEEAGRAKADQLEGNSYFRKMKFKAYSRLRRGREEAQELAMGRSESELKPHSQEQIDGLRTEARFKHPARHLFFEKQHSSQTNIAARISNKENHPLHEDAKRRSTEEDSSFPLAHRIIHEK